MSPGGAPPPVWTANRSGVETVLEDRHAAVPRLGEGGDQSGEAGLDRHGVDVAARHRHVAGILLAEMQDVEQHLPLDMAEIADRRRLALAILDRLLDLVAQCRFAVIAEDQGPDPAPECAALLRARTVLVHGFRLLPH
jgi:hypothetical protein